MSHLPLYRYGFSSFTSLQVSLLSYIYTSLLHLYNWVFSSSISVHVSYPLPLSYRCLLFFYFCVDVSHLLLPSYQCVSSSTSTPVCLLYFHPCTTVLIFFCILTVLSQYRCVSSSSAFIQALLLFLYLTTGVSPLPLTLIRCVLSFLVSIQVYLVFFHLHTFV